MVLKSKNLNFLQETVYEIMPGGLQIRTRDMSGYRATTVEFDHIAAESTRFQHSSPLARYCTITFAALAVITAASYIIWGAADPYAWVVWAVVAAISYLCYRITSYEGLRLESGRLQLFLHGNASELNAFIEELNRKKIARIRQRCSEHLFLSGPLVVFRYLLLLKDSRVVTPEQWEALKVEMLAEAHRAGFEDIMTSPGPDRTTTPS